VVNKKLVTLCVAVGGLVGSYILIPFGIDPLSGWSILTGALGGIIGIWVAVKLSTIY